jgi:hypothetical protein
MTISRKVVSVLRWVVPEVCVTQQHAQLCITIDRICFPIPKILHVIISPSSGPGVTAAMPWRYTASQVRVQVHIPVIFVFSIRILIIVVFVRMEVVLVIPVRT